MTPYATSAQLATYLGIPSPTDADRLLARASEVVLDSIPGAVYATDASHNATDSGVIATLRDAVCGQVEYWLAGDEEDDIVGPLESMSVGGQGQGFGSGSLRPTPMYLAPRAARHLRLGGLLSSSVTSV